MRNDTRWDIEAARPHCLVVRSSHEEIRSSLMKSPHCHYAILMFLMFARGMVVGHVDCRTGHSALFEVKVEVKKLVDSVEERI